MHLLLLAVPWDLKVIRAYCLWVKRGLQYLHCTSISLGPMATALAADRGSISSFNLFHSGSVDQCANRIKKPLKFLPSTKQILQITLPFVRACARVRVCVCVCVHVCSCVRVCVCMCMKGTQWRHHPFTKGT